MLSGALSDFTEADLTHAHVEEVDLTGVYWTSEGRSWPAGVRTGQVLTRSRETAPGV